MGKMLGEKKQKRGDIKMIAAMLQVTPRTLRNWTKSHNSIKPKVGRPRYTREQKISALVLVAREMYRQGYPGSTAIAKSLNGRVPLRLVVEYVRKLKARRRQRLNDRKLQHSSRISVLVKDAIWTQDGTHIGRIKKVGIESQVIKDRGSLKTIAVQTGTSAAGEDVLDVLRTLKETRGLPLVWMTDNGSSYCGQEIYNFLKEENVIHLKSLPHTPQHNGASEIGMRELKAFALLGKGVVLKSTYEGHAELVSAAGRQNNRLRVSKGFLNANRLDENMKSSSNLVNRNKFYKECTEELKSISNNLGWRKKRLAEREVILSKLESYGVIKRTRGCRTSE